MTLLSCASDRGTIGAVLAQDTQGRVRVVDTPPTLAAARAGVEPGDEILLIDGQSARDMKATEVHRILSGNVDQEVKLTLLRGDEIRRFTLRRSPAQQYSLSRRKE